MPRPSELTKKQARAEGRRLAERLRAADREDRHLLTELMSLRLAAETGKSSDLKPTDTLVLSGTVASQASTTGRASAERNLVELGIDTAKKRVTFQFKSYFASVELWLGDRNIFQVDRLMPGDELLYPPKYVVSNPNDPPTDWVFRSGLEWRFFQQPDVEAVKNDPDTE